MCKEAYRIIILTSERQGDVTAFDAVSQTLRVNGVSIPFSAIYTLKVSN